MACGTGRRPEPPDRAPTTPTTHANPPLTALNTGLVSAATLPASRSPRRGPPETTTKLTALSRPSKASGTFWSRIVPRKTALTMSAAPATPSNTAPSSSERLTLKPAIEPPHTATDASTPSPDVAHAPAVRRTRHRRIRRSQALHRAARPYAPRHRSAWPRVRGRSPAASRRSSRSSRRGRSSRSPAGGATHRRPSATAAMPGAAPGSPRRHRPQPDDV